MDLKLPYKQLLDRTHRLTIGTIIILTLINCTTSNSKDVGLFDRLFDKKQKTQRTSEIASDSLQLQKTAEMLDEQIFWAIIDKSLKETDNQDDQEQYLISTLTKLSPKEIIGFRLRTDFLLYHTYNSELWCAGYIMNGGCSDDCFEYFRCWIISRGKDVYFKAKADPDYLVSQVIEGTEFYEFESFWYVALEAFQVKTGEDLYEYIDDENFKTKEGSYPQFEFTWQEGNQESMRKICPNLYKKFND